MKFRMTCPKCGSTNFSIERDNRSYAARGQTFEMIFSCRCGKQMFGDQIVKEYERQKKDWEHHREARVERDIRSAAPKPQEARPAARTEPAQSPPSAEEEEEELEPAESLNTEEEELEESEDSGICGWAPCSNPPRPNSKYCSRDCSNKNARWRYKQRKAAEKEAA